MAAEGLHPEIFHHRWKLYVDCELLGSRMSDFTSLELSGSRNDWAVCSASTTAKLPERNLSPLPSRFV